MQEVGIEKKTLGSVLRAFIWNSGGMGVYFACKWGLTIIVVRLSDSYDDAGYLALAMSVANMCYCIAIYGIRGYQVSDTKGEHTTSTYVSARVMTVIAAFIVCVVYCLAFIGFDKRSAIVILFMILISGEALSDVFQGIAQRRWRMDIVGLSFFLRGVVLISSFTTLYLIYNLTAAVLGSAVLTLLVVWLFDVRQVSRLEPFHVELIWGNLRSLLVKCLPLMIMMFLQISFTSMARIAVNSAFSVTELGIFNSATLPAGILYQFAIFVFLPFINVLSESFAAGDYKRFNRQVLYLCGIVFLMICAAIFVSMTIGGFMLSILFDEEIYDYSYLLTEALLAMGIASLLWFLCIVLTVIRKLAVILIGCSIGFLCSIVSASWFLDWFGMSGANYMQYLGLGISTSILLVAYCVYMHRLKRGQ